MFFHFIVPCSLYHGPARVVWKSPTSFHHITTGANHSYFEISTVQRHHNKWRTLTCPLNDSAWKPTFLLKRPLFIRHSFILGGCLCYQPGTSLWLGTCSTAAPRRSAMHLPHFFVSANLAGAFWALRNHHQYRPLYYSKCFRRKMWWREKTQKHYFVWKLRSPKKHWTKKDYKSGTKKGR